jgi:hypothetical protein
MSEIDTAESQLGERILAAVRGAPKPVTFKSLAKVVKAKEEPLRAALEAAITTNLVYRWPDFRRSQYFWHISPEQRAREALIAAASTQALSKSSLSKAAAKHLPGFPVKQLELQVSSLVTAQQLAALPAFTGNAKLYITPGNSAAYFQSARIFLEGKIRAAGFDPAGLFPAQTSPHEKPADQRVDTPDLILEAVRSLEPVRGVPVSTLRLRKHLSDVEKQEFDAAALELRRKQQVFLSLHADPYNLSEEDKSLLIDGQDGTYYVAIGLR